MGSITGERGGNLPCSGMPCVVLRRVIPGLVGESGWSASSGGSGGSAMGCSNEMDRCETDRCCGSPLSAAAFAVRFIECAAGLGLTGVLSGLCG